jgi:GT2 family glycosyltransferase
MISRRKIAIVILNWNDYPVTRDCLLSLRKISYRDFFAVIVDNGSIDGSGEKLRDEFPENTYIFNGENLGFAEGNNRGIVAALKDGDCEYVFCLNNDTIVDRECLTNLLKFADSKEYSKWGSFQTRMIAPDQPNLIGSAGLEYSWNGLGFNRGASYPVQEYSENAEIFGCCGGAALYRREAIENLISNDSFFFDPYFFIYYEDVDVSFRLQMNGWKSLYIASAIVLHLGGGALKKSKNSLKRSFFVSHRNNLFVIAKNLPTEYILRNIVPISIAQVAAVVVNFLRPGKPGPTVLRAKIVGIKKWGAMRKRGQKTRKGIKNWEEIERTFVKRWKAKKPSDAA